MSDYWENQARISAERNARWAKMLKTKKEAVTAFRKALNECGIKLSQKQAKKAIQAASAYANAKY